MTAACGSCAAPLPGAVPSPELRCETCAVAEVDATARASTRKGLALVGVGIAVLLLAVLMWRANWNPGETTMY